MSAFGLSADQAGHAADVFAFAQANANTSVEQMGEAMNYLAPTANSLGWSLEEASAVIMELANNGLKGSMATQAFGSSLVRLSAPTPKAAKLIKELGMEFFDAEGNMKSMPEVLAEMEKGLAGMSEQQKAAAMDVLVGKNAYKQWQILLKSGSGTMAEMTAELEKADGTAAAMADTMLDNLGGAFVLLKSAMEGAAITIGNTLMPYIKAATEVINKLVDWFNKLPAPVQQAIVIVTALVGALALIAGPLLLLIGFIPQIIAGFTAFMTVVKAIGAALAFLTSPISLVVAAVIAAAALIYVYWEPISEFFIKLWDVIKEAGIALWETLKVAWAATVDFFVGLWDGIAEFFTSLWTSIVTVATSVWDAVIATWQAVVAHVKKLYGPLLDYFANLWTTIVKTATTIWDTMTSTLETVWNAIKTGAKAAWELIKNVILGPILLLIDLVTGDMEGFRSNLTAIWENIKSAASTIWESLKTAVSAIMDAAVKYGETLWGAFKETLSNLWNAMKQVAVNVWNDLKERIITLTASIKTAAENKFKEMKTAVVNKFTELKSDAIDKVKNLVKDLVGKWEDLKTKTTDKIKAVKDSVINPLKEIDLLQIGKDIINGFINGIKSKVDAVADAAKSAADAVTGKIKSILKIKSPSRVMMEIGKWISVGMADGIDSGQSRATKAISDLGYLLIDVVDHYKSEEVKVTKKANEEIAKIEKRSAQDIAKVHSAAKAKKRNLTQAEVIKIQRIEEDSAKKILDIQKKSMTEKIKMMEESDKKLLEEIKLFLEDKKSLEQLSLVDEAAIWEKSIKLFSDGTKQKVEAQKAYQAALKTINDEIIKTNEDYAGKMANISAKLREEEQKLTEEYEKSVNDRASALQNFVGVFDFFEVKIEKTGEDLLANLTSQVHGFKRWQQEIDELATKAIDKGLLEELRAMGPKALPELIALNSLTDAQMSQYSALYREKSKLAREQAEKELIGMKADTKKRIDELRTTANRELDTLRSEWAAKIKAVTRTTDDELKSLKSIGRDAGRGLLDGLASMEPSLMQTARSIANSISKEIANALKVKSPSRVMMEIGRFVGEGLAKGMESQINAVKSAANDMADAAVAKPTLKYATPSGSYASVASAIDGTVDVNDSRDSRIADAINGLERKLENLRIEMNGREFGRAVSDVVTESRNTEIRGRGRRRL